SFEDIGFLSQVANDVHHTHTASAEPSAGGRNGVAFPCVGLLSNPQCVQLRLEGPSIDYFGRSNFIFHLHRSLRITSRSTRYRPDADVLKSSAVERLRYPITGVADCRVLARRHAPNQFDEIASAYARPRGGPYLASNSSHRSIKPARRHSVPRLCNANP